MKHYSKLNKILCTLLMGGFTINNLSACIGNNQNTNSLNNAPIPANQKNQQSVWGNITGADGLHKTSNLYLVGSNDSPYDVHFIGCINSDGGVEDHLHDIFANTNPALTKDYDLRWKNFDNGHGIIDSAKLKNNYIHFNDIALGDVSANCYYTVAGKNIEPMSFKLVMQNKYTNSYSTDGKLVLTQPIDDIKALDAGWKQAIVGVSETALAGALIGVGVKNYVPLRNYFTNQDIGLRNLLSTIRSRSSQQIEDFEYFIYLKNRKLTSLATDGISSDLQKERFAAWNEYCTKYKSKISLENYTWRYDKNWMEFRKSYLEFLDRYDSKYADNVADLQLANYNNQLELMKNATQSKHIDLIKAENEELILNQFDKQAPRLRYSTTQLENVITEWETLTNNLNSHVIDLSEYFTKFNAEINPSLRQLNVLSSGVDIELNTITKQLKSQFLRAQIKAVASEVVVAVGIEAIINFVALPWILHQTGQVPGGAFTTGYTEYTLAPVSNSEAIEVNQQIAPFDANNNETLQNYKVYGGANLTYTSGNSLHNSFTLSPTSKGNDKQTSLTLNLASMTTPFVRQDPEGKVDPYLNDISDNEHNSAVLSLDIIGQNQLATQQDNLFEINKYIYDKAGIGILSGDSRLPAPNYQLNSISNFKSKQQLFSKSQTNSSLKGIKLKTGIEGIVLNDNDELDLTVSIPNNNNNNVLYANGLLTNLVYEDESKAANSFNVVHSEQLFNKALQANDQPESAPTLLANYNCNFPLKVGDNCNLKLKVHGLDDGKHHLMKLAIADKNSKITAIPVYANYKLLSEPFAFNLDQGTQGNFSLNLKNYGSTNYANLTINGLPKDAQITANSCSNGLNSTNECQINFNLANLEEGSYHLEIVGKDINGNNQEADISTLDINVNGGW